MPLHSLTDLTGLRISDEDFLAAVSETAARPVLVVGPDDVIRFANPAAITALGYDRADDLLGRHRHETIHFMHPGGTPYPAADCPMQLPRTTGQTVARDLDWFFRRDGSTFPVSYVLLPIELPEGRGAVVTFADIEDRLRGEQVLGGRDAVLGGRDAVLGGRDAVLGAREDSLRRIAALVAGGAASVDVFAAIAREVAHVVGLPLVLVWRFDPGKTTASVIAEWSEVPHSWQTGTRWPLDGPGLAVQMLKTGRPARIDDYTELPGTIAAASRETRLRGAAGAPIIVDGDMWGWMAAADSRASLPNQIEDRLAEFTELVATAISNTESRARLGRLAEEQAALRKVATLVARGTRPEQVFATVANEVGRLLSADLANVCRYESDGAITFLASASDRFPIGSRWPIQGHRNLATLVLETGRPARLDNYADATGPLAEGIREDGIRSAVGTPIRVEGRLWGLMAAGSSQEQPLPPDTEARLGSFTELVATAIANAEARAQVAASRARIVAAADEERRRVVRDLHDGAQQRLVHTVITLKLAHRAMQNGDENAPELVTEALDHAQRATNELRELAHGILPAALTQGGLRSGVDALTSRMAVPVETAVSVGRLPAAVEATAYFVVAEALTNVAKHSRAAHAAVTARVGDRALEVKVRDDGVGGARPDGSGLLGLRDRLAVVDGQLRIESPADGGTLVAADIPLSS
ncbi:MAG TPA: GAF domain-containing protein [Solirubrobacteraceae bacterium]|nr:GAF domain-containing protein [Solirubrobacteraceae bacterium]